MGGSLTSHELADRASDSVIYRPRIDICGPGGSVGEVGSPYFLGPPLARPFGVRQRVVGMIGSIRRGVELMQRVDDEAAVAQDVDPLAVAAVELYPAPRRCQAVCPALRVEQFLAGRARPVPGSTR